MFALESVLGSLFARRWWWVDHGWAGREGKNSCSRETKGLFGASQRYYLLVKEEGSFCLVESPSGGEEKIHIFNGHT